MQGLHRPLRTAMWRLQVCDTDYSKAALADLPALLAGATWVRRRPVAVACYAEVWGW
jgi:hypothetical protein